MFPKHFIKRYILEKRFTCKTLGEKIETIDVYELKQIQISIQNNVIYMG